MGEVIEQQPHNEICCGICATKINEIHESITKIANALSSIDLSGLENSMMGKMLGLGKK